MELFSIRIQRTFQLVSTPIFFIIDTFLQTRIPFLLESNNRLFCKDTQKQCIPIYLFKLNPICFSSQHTYRYSSLL